MKKLRLLACDIKAHHATVRTGPVFLRVVRERFKVFREVSHFHSARSLTQCRARPRRAVRDQGYQTYGVLLSQCRPQAPRYAHFNNVCKTQGVLGLGDIKSDFQNDHKLVVAF